MRPSVDLGIRRREERAGGRDAGRHASRVLTGHDGVCAIEGFGAGGEGGCAGALVAPDTERRRVASSITRRAPLASHERLSLQERRPRADRDSETQYSTLTRHECMTLTWREKNARKLSEETRRSRPHALTRYGRTIESALRRAEQRGAASEAVSRRATFQTSDLTPRFPRRLWKME